MFFSALDLVDFNVGVSDSAATPVADPLSYTLCSHEESSLPVGETTLITCDNPVAGKYVIIQLRGADTKLELCEVEVYEKIYESKWC